MSNLWSNLFQSAIFITLTKNFSPLAFDFLYAGHLRIPNPVRVPMSNTYSLNGHLMCRWNKNNNTHIKQQLLLGSVMMNPAAKPCALLPNLRAAR